MSNYNVATARGAAVALTGHRAGLLGYGENGSRSTARSVLGTVRERFSPASDNVLQRVAGGEDTDKVFVKLDS
jgi:hypothetical protein